MPFLILNAQDSYTNAIHLGDRSLQKKQFVAAIKYYFVAEAFQPDSALVVKARIKNVFKAVEQLKLLDEKNVIQLKKEKKRLDQAQLNAQRNLE